MMPFLSWKFDFNQCGLVIKSILIKARSWSFESNENNVIFSMESDLEGHNITHVTLGDYYKELPSLRGSSVLTLKAEFNVTQPDMLSPQLLQADDKDCPLDVIVNLMCPKPLDAFMTSEILLGLKYNPHGANESLKKRADIAIDCGLMAGQLQLHLVEGAGLVKNDSKKALNSFLKCSLIPDPHNFTTRQTNPVHSAYPTWSKELIYAGVDSFDLSQSGLEILVYDKPNVFSQGQLVGGIRLSTPQKRDDEEFLKKRFSVSTGNLCGRGSFSGPSSLCHSPSVGDHPNGSGQSSTLPNSFFKDFSNNCSVADIEFTQTLTEHKRSPSISSLSSVDSPLVRRAPVFTLPRDRESALSVSSPRSSPVPLRRSKSPKTMSPRLSPKLFTKKNHHKQQRQQQTEYLYDWMDSKGNEINHWKAILGHPGEWIYSWHLIRTQIKPAHEL
jgi:hypothetical protein